MADLLSCARVVLAAALLVFALAGSGLGAAAALVTGGVTDAIDGRLARRRGSSSLGAHLDAAADIALLSCTAAALEILHPEIAAGNAFWLAAVSVVFVSSLGASWIASGRLVDPSRLTGKLAGGLLYLFAVTTLALGGYSPALLGAALGMLAASSAEAILRATATIQAKGTARATRSQAPHQANGVSRSPEPATSSAASSAAATRETTP